jgi:hypothetical protein
MIREERDGVRLLVDVTKGDQASVIAAVENVRRVELRLARSTPDRRRSIYPSEQLVRNLGHGVAVECPDLPVPKGYNTVPYSFIQYFASGVCH